MIVAEPGGNLISPKLQLVAWEITRGCNLFCAHCRASADGDGGDDELKTAECYRVIDEILEVGRPIIIMTGGEPLVRRDFPEIAKYAASRGLRVVVGTNGTVINGEMAAMLKEIPVSRVGISLDFPTAELQDDFRGKAGAFQAALEGISQVRKAGIGVQINSTITRLNARYLDDLLSLAMEVGAIAFHPFMLVPTGRGKNLESVVLSAAEHEATLNWIYERQSELGNRMFFRPIDAPHYFRIIRQKQKREPHKPVVTGTSHGERSMDTLTRGCLAGTGFCFISHQGRVQGCGYLDVAAGNVRENRFSQIWYDSPLFQHLRDLSLMKGKCGECEYKRVCGGCRARAYEATGDYLEAEPYCIYQPRVLAREPEG